MNSDFAPAAIKLERQFAENRYTGSRSGPSLLLIEGSIPVVLSSPHAVKHPRRGRLKNAEIYTGALAVQLASLTKTSALIYAQTSDEDPGFDADGEYKRQLRDLVTQCHVQFVLDIHGLTQRRSMEIAVGTGGRDHKNLLGRVDLLDVLENMLKKAEITHIVKDHPNYAASRPNTIGSFISRELQIPALQIEVHQDYRDPRNKPNEYARLLHALDDAIGAIAELL